MYSCFQFTCEPGVRTESWALSVCVVYDDDVTDTWWCRAHMCMHGQKEESRRRHLEALRVYLCKELMQDAG